MSEVALKKKIPFKKNSHIIATQPSINPDASLVSSKLILPHGQSWVEIAETLPKLIQMDQLTFERIWNLHPKEYANGIIFGQSQEFKRWDQSYGQDYKYAGKLHKSLPIEDPFLDSLLKWVSSHSGQEYKAILINWYQDGTHYIGYHADSESSIVANSAIYSFSYGQERDFCLKSKDKSHQQKIYMKNGSLIIMGGEMQKYYKHAVPKRALSTCPERRINITLRLFKL